MKQGFKCTEFFISIMYCFFFAGLEKRRRIEFSQARAKKKQYMILQPGCREKKTVHDPLAGRLRKKKQYMILRPGGREKKQYMILQSGGRPTVGQRPAGWLEAGWLAGGRLAGRMRAGRPEAGRAAGGGLAGQRPTGPAGGRRLAARCRLAGDQAMI